MDKQTERQENLCETLPCTGEHNFKNFSPNRPHPDKAHGFNSYTNRPEVFPPRLGPEYNLLNVNYDRLLPRGRLGDAGFARYANWHNTKLENMDPQPMGRLEYERKEENF